MKRSTTHGILFDDWNSLFLDRINLSKYQIHLHLLLVLEFLKCWCTKEYLAHCQVSYQPTTQPGGTRSPISTALFMGHLLICQASKLKTHEWSPRILGTMTCRYLILTLQSHWETTNLCDYGSQGVRCSASCLPGDRDTLTLSTRLNPF